jgi:glucosyl-dolichyl phosphate glucuronosyltransferase
MFLSVIVCTYNRHQTLRKTLDSIAASRVPSSVGWEILVVDNNSTDCTREVVADYCRLYPLRFRYLRESRQGLSIARNAGVRESRGDILAFTDDDVTVDPGWLWSLTAALDTGEWAGAGGRIIPVWGQPLPRWLSPSMPDMSGPFVAFDLGLLPIPLTQSPFGANMAFRRDVFNKYGGFRIDLGRCGDSLRTGEDVEFGGRLLKAGERLRYEPSAVVHHPVSGDRLRKKYLLSWFFGKGCSDLMRFGVPQETNWSLAGVPVCMLRRFGRWSVQWLVSIRPSDRFVCRLNVWYNAGTILTCYQLSRSKNQLAEYIRR